MLSEFSNVFAIEDTDEISSDEEDDNETAPSIQRMSSEAMIKLYEMRVNNQLCDGEICLDDKKTFQIHRAILCACSAYFRYKLCATCISEWK